jgi:hypothetical protein
MPAPAKAGRIARDVETTVFHVASNPPENSGRADPKLVPTIRLICERAAWGGRERLVLGVEDGFARPGGDACHGDNDFRCSGMYQRT